MAQRRKVVYPRRLGRRLHILVTKTFNPAAALDDSGLVVHSFTHSFIHLLIASLSEDLLSDRTAPGTH